MPGCSSGRLLQERARVGPRPWSRIRKRLRARSFVLSAWSSCSGPRQPAASELAVVPSTTPVSLSPNAWPARPRQAAARHILGPMPLRAFHRVPSDAGVRADYVVPCPVTDRAAVLLIEIDFISWIGPSTPISTAEWRQVRRLRRINACHAVIVVSKCHLFFNWSVATTNNGKANLRFIYCSRRFAS